jgi:hypothetical protein
MKKLLVTTAVFISAIIFWSCNSTTDPKPEPTECNHCKTYTGGFKGIPVKLAYEMVDLYKQHHWQNYTVKTGDNTAPTDARTVWFSLDSLKRYIWYIEEEVCKNKCVNPDDLGLRFYYGEYPDKETWAKLDGENDPASMKHKEAYQGLHTILIVPTYYSKNSDMNVDFDPHETTMKDGKCSPTPLQDVFDSREASSKSKDAKQNERYKPMVYMYSADVNSTIKNKGSLIPPPPPSAGRAGENNGAVILDKLENVNKNYGF